MSALEKAREACAKVCEDEARAEFSRQLHSRTDRAMEYLAARIRALDLSALRGEQVNAVPHKPGSESPDRLVSISVDGSTHTRTAADWLALARADIRQAPAPLAGLPEPKIIAWLIRNYGVAGHEERELVFSPLTDQHFIDDGGEAYPLIHKNAYDALRGELEIGKSKEYQRGRKDEQAAKLNADFSWKQRAESAESAAAALRERLEAVERDAVRIDFMEKNPKVITRAFGYLGSPDAWSYTIDGTTYTATTIRAAIDAALAAEGRKP